MDQDSKRCGVCWAWRKPCLACQAKYVASAEQARINELVMLHVPPLTGYGPHNFPAGNYSVSPTGNRVPVVLRAA